MYKVILMIAAVFFMFQISNAQRTSSENVVSLGVKIGLNISSVYDTKSEDFYADPKLGLATGFFITVPIINGFEFQPEVLFSQKGYKRSGSYLGVVSYEFVRTSSFIDIPFLLAYKPADIFRIVAGPQFSYLIYQKNVFTSGDFSEQQTEEFENDNIRKNIMCFLGGFDININPIVVGARAGWDIHHNNGNGTSTDPRYKNVWYQATIGYRFQ